MWVWETFTNITWCSVDNVILEPWWQRSGYIFSLCLGVHLHIPQCYAKISFISTVCLPRDFGYRHLRRVSLFSERMSPENFTSGNFCRKFSHWPSDGHGCEWQKQTLYIKYIDALQAQPHKFNLTVILPAGRALCLSAVWLLLLQWDDSHGFCHFSVSLHRMGLWYKNIMIW